MRISRCMGTMLPRRVISQPRIETVALRQRSADTTASRVPAQTYYAVPDDRQT